jgi:23S rRNA-intervening sequence protein
MKVIFDHEKLEVYGLQLQFVAWTADFLIEASQSPVAHRRELLSQLDRACLSILLNSAEGNGKRHGLQRAKFFDDARAQHWNVRPAWTPPSPSESQRAIESIPVSSVHLQLMWESGNFTRSSVPLIESLKSKPHSIIDARNGKT